MRRPVSAVGAILILAAGCGKEPDLPPGAVRPVPPEAAAPKPVPVPPIAFIRDGNVWVIRPDGTGARAVTRLRNADAADPAWSPDRTRIAFTARIDPEFALYERNIFVVSAAGGHPAQVTPLPRAGASRATERKGRVTGRVIRMQRGLKMPVHGFRVTAYGLRRHVETGADGRFQLLAPHGGAWVKAVGTHDGLRLTAWRFAATQQGRLSDLGDMIATADDEEIASSPAWSPDGGAIAYQLRRKRTGGVEQVRVRRIRPDGSGDELLHDSTRDGLRGGPVLRAGAVWFKQSDGRITMLDLETRRVVRSLPAGVSIPDGLAVSPDGRTLATLKFNERIAPTLAIVRGEDVETVAAFEGDAPVPHALDFSPDGSKLIMDRRTRDGASDLWILELATRTFTRLTDDGSSSLPVWHGR